MSNPDLMSDDWKRGTELLEKEFQKWRKSIERGGGIAVDSFLVSGWECELVGRLARERDEAKAESERLKQERDGFAKDLCRWLGDDEGRRLCREEGEE